MESIHAIYEGGVFRPVAPVELPEHAEFVFEPRLVVPRINENKAEPESNRGSDEGLRKVYAILSERYASGYTDTAARHNEHQP